MDMGQCIDAAERINEFSHGGESRGLDEIFDARSLRRGSSLIDRNASMAKA